MKLTTTHEDDWSGGVIAIDTLDDYPTMRVTIRHNGKITKKTFKGESSHHNSARWAHDQVCEIRGAMGKLR